MLFSSRELRNTLTKFSSSRIFPGQEYVVQNRLNQGAVFRQLRGLSAVSFRDEAEEQRKDVFGTLPQGWEVQLQNVEAVIEIFPEVSALYELPQIPVGGRHYAGIEADDFAAADVHQLLLLDDPEQFSLEREGEFSDLVQKQTSVIGKLEQTGLAAFSGAGEGAFVISEEFTLEEGFADGGAVYRHERAAGPSPGWIFEAMRPSPGWISGAGRAYFRMESCIFLKGIL